MAGQDQARRGLHPAGVFAILLAAALVLRWTTLGDPNLHGDEVFYHTVGVAMHGHGSLAGALPYVDVWDRKPFGLFALSWAIAAVSSDMLAFQIAAALSCAATAWCIARLAGAWTSPRGGLLAGLVYLLYLGPLQCFGAQSPVFYNLFIAAAALLTYRALPDLRAGRVPGTVLIAMLVAGFGITIKTTAFFEAAFLGLAAATALRRSQMPLPRWLRQVLLWALIGAAPSLAFAAAYGAMGHWSEFWHAMVTANLDKEPHWPTSLARLKFMAMVLLPAIVLALLGLRRMEPQARGFVAWWIAAAIAGLIANPNFYLHYAAPLAVPLCAAMAAFLARGMMGSVIAAGLAALSLQAAPMKPGHAAKSAAAIAELKAHVRGHKGAGPLLLYDAPPQLYVETGQPFVTPLVFPTHLSHAIEKDTSHLSTLAETRRVLALKPGAVVMAVPLRNGPVNEETHALVLAYVGAHCRLVKVVPTLEWQRTDQIAVWGDCG